MTRRLLAGRVVAGEQNAEPPERRLEQGRVDDASLPRRVPLVQRGDRPERSPNAGPQIEHLHADAGGRAIFGAVDAEEARKGLNDGFVTGFEMHRTLVSEGPQGA